MQAKIGVRIGFSVVLKDEDTGTTYEYTVMGVRVKRDSETGITRYTTIALQVKTKDGAVVANSRIEIPQNRTINMGKIKLATRRVTPDMAIVHFMYPKWLPVDEHLSTLQFSEMDKIGIPTKGEQEYVTG